jgi:hypothetical protein
MKPRVQQWMAAAHYTVGMKSPLHCRESNTRHLFQPY